MKEGYWMSDGSNSTMCEINQGGETPDCMMADDSVTPHVWKDMTTSDTFDYINCLMSNNASETAGYPYTYTIQLESNTYTSFSTTPIDPNTVTVSDNKSAGYLTSLVVTVKKMPPSTGVINGQEYFSFNVSMVTSGGKKHDPKISVGPTIPN